MTTAYQGFMAKDWTRIGLLALSATEEVTTIGDDKLQDGTISWKRAKYLICFGEGSLPFPMFNMAGRKMTDEL